MSTEVRPDPSRRMIYQTPETRERIIAVARELFTERGLFDTQMKDIAAAVKISRTSLYRYFQDKQDLAMAILEQLAEEMNIPRFEAQGLGSEGRGIDRVVAFFHATWLSPRFARHVKFMAEFDAYFSGPRVPADFREHVAKALHKGQVDPLAASIIEGIRDGSVRADVDPHLAAVTILNSVRGLQQRLLLRGDTLVEVAQGELTRMLLELLDYLVMAIATPKTS